MADLKHELTKREQSICNRSGSFERKRRPEKKNPRSCTAYRRMGHKRILEAAGLKDVVQELANKAEFHQPNKVDLVDVAFANLAP